MLIHAGFSPPHPSLGKQNHEPGARPRVSDRHCARRGAALLVSSRGRGGRPGSWPRLRRSRSRARNAFAATWGRAACRFEDWSLRASREASKHSTAPTSPAHSHATSRSKPGRETRRCALIKDVGFARDSPLEGSGFELLVPQFSSCSARPALLRRIGARLSKESQRDLRSR
jgi:hypothetical protein